MIDLKLWNTLTEKKQDELSDNAFSYRQCERCNNYYHLGEDEEQNAEGMYLNSSEFECSEQKIIEYEKKHNIYIDDNVFCWDCSEKLCKDLKN